MYSFLTEFNKHDAMNGGGLILLFFTLFTLLRSCYDSFILRQFSYGTHYETRFSGQRIVCCNIHYEMQMVIGDPQGGL